MQSFSVQEMKEKIPTYVHRVLDALAQNGYHGYLVGGSLRDLLRGLVPHDFDLTTDATPDEMQKAFADFHTVPTGLKHGTLTVMSDGNPIEVTTHRCDGEYLDHRHPQSVGFTTRLADDLSRRDFTVNAMAWSEETGLVDLFGGMEDLARGVIRAVGDPARRFDEDALRILRAFRFSAQLGFLIDEKTQKAAAACREGLAQISCERIFSELSRLLESPACAKGLAALLEAQCAPYVFFDTPVAIWLVGELDRLSPNAALRLAALLWDAPLQKARGLCRKLRTSNKFSDTVVGLIEATRADLPTTPYEARRFVCHHFHYFREALLLRQWRGEQVGEAEALCHAVCRDGSAVDLHRLRVNGKELQQALSVRACKTGELLHLLQDAVWRSPEQNRREALLALAREICEDKEGFCDGNKI